MITILVSEINRAPMKRLIRTAGKAIPKINMLTYTQAFRRYTVPAGCLIFSDFDLLSDIELDAACAIAAAAQDSGQLNLILNDPRYALERYDLLSHLHATGQNPVEVTRLKDGERPLRYPILVRLEDGCLRPDFDLIPDENAYDSAIASLVKSGRSLRGRMTASFEAAPDHDGYYRKYGAFRIGDHIVPQHILRSPDWIVKSSRVKASGSFVDEEFAFVRDNPHRDALMKVFNAVNIGFGRVDYTVRNGKIVVFEINTNPTFPRFSGGESGRQPRRDIILNGLVKAFQSINVDGKNAKVPFVLAPGAARYLVLRREGISGRLVRLWSRPKKVRTSNE